jgi:Sap, sulfolipid-1-addressing protein
MGTLAPEIALFGLAVALTSPGSVVTVIALLSMSYGRARVVAFIAGWLVAIGVIAILTVEVLRGQDFHSNHTSPSRAASAAEVLIGGLLVIVAARAYRQPQHKPKSQEPPKWLARVERSNPLLELIVGMVMLSYGLTLAAAAETLKAHPSAVDAALVGLVFAATSIITIAAPLAIVLIAPDRSAAVLTTWRDWMLAHSRAIALIALMVIGVALMARGIHDLAT